MAKTTAEAVHQALIEKGQFVVKESSEGPNQLRLLGSVPQNKVATSNWLLLVHHLLVRASTAEWKVDISKSYFLRDGKTWWGWRLIFQAPGRSLEACYDDITKTISTAPRTARVEMTGVDLPRRSYGRANVGPSGSVPTGPFVVRR